MGRAINRKISGRIFVAAIVLEMALIALGTLLVHGVPGFGRDEGPPSVTIQYAPQPAHAPLRAYNI